MRWASAAQRVVPTAWLYGWDQIAQHMGVSRNTAQRWHGRRAMPLVYVRRKVCTARSALDQWLLSRPMMEGMRYAVPQPRCPHCGLRPSDPPRARPSAPSSSPTPDSKPVQVE